MFQHSEQARQFGVTAVENLFITEFLPAADANQLKVYLYGLYASQFADENFNLQQLANALSIEEGQALAALRYWERRRLVERVKDNPPVYVFHPVGYRFLTGQDQLSVDQQYVVFSEAVHAQLGSRRKLRESDISLAYEWVEEEGLPPELVLMLLNHMAETRGAQFSFKSAQTTAMLMKNEGITTAEEAEQFFSHSKQTHTGARAVLTQFNMRRLPTEPELAMYRKWTEQWGFDEQGILAAVSETVAANNPSFSYLNGILERLKGKVQQREGKQVQKLLQQEEADTAQVKQVLVELGKPQISPHILLPAFKALKEAYSFEMILLAARSVQARGGKFEDIEARLSTWAKQGLQDDQQVVAHLRALKQYEPLMNRIYEASGQVGKAGEQDLLLLRTWLSQGHSEELLLEAASKAIASKDHYKLGYINTVLNNWHKKGIKTPEAARQEGDLPAGSRKKKVNFADYDQEQGSVDQPFDGIDLLKEARDSHGQ